MWIIFGSSTDVKELGAVADQCPHCNRLTPCFVTGQSQGVHVYFITLAEQVTAAECLCSACGGRFRCELWRYNDFVPATEAHAIPLEVLLERTNPALMERLAWAHQQKQFASDARFTTTLESVEQLNQGRLRTEWLDQLKRWDQLAEVQRTNLAQISRETAEALRFARSMAGQLSSAVGCLPASLACLTVWSAFFWAPAVRNLFFGAVTVFIGLAAGTVVNQLFISRRVQRWVKEVLIPEGEISGINFARFITVLEDLPPPSPHRHNELTGLKENAAVILRVLAASGKIVKSKG